MPIKNPISLERRNEILTAIATAVSECKHHVAFSKRILQQIKSVLPEYIVVVNVEKRDHIGDKYEIKVWGKEIVYDDMLWLSWTAQKDRTWYEGFLHEVALHDNSDTLERMRDEEAILPQLIGYDLHVQDLLRQLREAREQAFELFSTLPVPKSASVRAEPHYWNGPTSKTRERFPRLFKGDNDEKE